ncbi:MAG: helix-turn-helix domain-containing protein, partial [Granulosicoccaceae bacterium]
MAETAALFATLKSALKAEEKTYADVAEVLFLSEASVKQMFRNQRMSIERLDVICNELLGMEISELVEVMSERQERMSTLDEDMELRLVSDVRLLLVAVHIMNGWAPVEIVNVYEIDMPECKRHLSVLEQ